MNHNLKRAIAGTLALAGVVMAAAEAEALPMQNLAPSVTVGSNVDQAYLVCGPYRCYRRYGWRRPYYGYRRPWRRRYYRW